MSKYKYDKSSGYVRKSVRNGWNALSGIPLLRELRKLERQAEMRDQNAKLREALERIYAMRCGDCCNTAECCDNSIIASREALEATK